MTTAILDTNIAVQYLISSPRSASVRTIEAYFEGRFRLAYSQETLDGLFDLLTHPPIRALHALNDDEILDFIASLMIDAERFAGIVPVSAVLTRDVTDTKFLSLEAESDADFLVTNDRRHLLPLKQFRRTRIVTPARFLRELP